MKKLLVSLLFLISLVAGGQRLDALPTLPPPSTLAGLYTLTFYETFPGSGVWVSSARKVLFSDLFNPYLKKADSTIYSTLWGKKKSLDSLALLFALANHNHNGIYQPTGSYITVETDPGVPSFVKGITAANFANGNTAFAWGAHSGLYPLTQRFLDSIAAVKSLVASGGISVDPVPVDGSTNPISSNGVFDANTLKVDKVAGKGLSTEDYTTSEKNKLAGIATGATAETGATIVTKLTGLTGNNRLPASAIKDLPSGSVAAQTATAYVDNTYGNNSSAEPGNASKPFLTIDAALDALPSTAGVVIISPGTYASPTPAKIKSGTVFLGSGRPTPNMVTTPGSFTTNTSTSPTKLLGGTILQGTFSVPYNIDRITIKKLGVDVGLDYVNASHGGMAQEGLLIAQDFSGNGTLAADGVHRLQTSTTLRQGITVENVSILCKSATSTVHAFLLENSYNPSVKGVHTYFGFAGIVIKTIGGIFTDLHANGHDIFGLVLKSNDYSHCYGVVVDGFECRSIAPGDGAGVTIDSDDAGSPGIGYLTITNGTCFATKFGVHGYGANIDNVSLQNITTVVPTVFGINLEEGTLYNLQNCTVRAAPGNGIRVNSDAANKSSVTGCSSDGNTGYGFELNNCLYNGLRAIANTTGAMTGSGNTVF